MQVATWYCTRMGFRLVGYKGLETGSRQFAHYLLQNGQTFFVVVAPLGDSDKFFNEHLKQHGDGLRDVGFTVEGRKGM